MVLLARALFALVGASVSARAAVTAPPDWRSRYDVRFGHSAPGVPTAEITATLRWLGKPGDHPASVELDMADDGFPGGYGAFVRGFEAVAPAGGPAARTLASASAAAEPLSIPSGRYRLPVGPDGAAEFRYTVVLEHDPAEWGPGPDEAPYRFEGGALWTGRALFITAPDARAEVSFVALEGERVSVSFEPVAGRPGTYAVPSATRLRDSFLMVGRHRETRLAVGNAVVILALGGGLAASAPQVEEDLRSFLEAAGRIFDGAPPARVLVAGNLGAPPGSLHGGGFGDDLSLLADVPLGAANADRWRPFLCHEVFHLWNGNAIRFEAAQQYWWSEGVTEYYAHLLPVRLGVMGEERFLESIRRKAAAYLEAAGPTSLLAAGDDKFLSQALLYDGGALAALILDLKIRAATSSRRSLDDVLARLYRAARRRPGEDTTLAGIGAALAAVAGRPLDDFLERHITGTEPLPLAESLALAGLRLRSEIADLPEAGAVLAGLLRCPSVTAGPDGLRVLRSESEAIRAGDLIVEVAGHPVRSFDDLRRAAHDLEPAARRPVAVLRDGARLNFEITLGGRAGDPVPRSHHVAVVLEEDPSAPPAARALRRGLLAGERR